jgi:hypothetical protein
MSSLASETVLFRASRRHRPSVSVRQIPSCADVRCASAHWAVRSSSHRIGWHLGLVGLALLRSGAGTPRAPDPPAAPPMAAATAPEPGWTEATIAELMTSEHNRARAQVRWGAAAPPGLTWSTSLAGLARDWANNWRSAARGCSISGRPSTGRTFPPAPRSAAAVASALPRSWRAGWPKRHAGRRGGSARRTAVTRLASVSSTARGAGITRKWCGGTLATSAAATDLQTRRPFGRVLGLSLLATRQRPRSGAVLSAPPPDSCAPPKRGRPKLSAGLFGRAVPRRSRGSRPGAASFQRR